MTSAKILIVDDEPNIRFILEDALSRDGHQVVAASSGEEAVSLINTQTFDLALLDLVLPGMNGLEILAILRQQAPDTIVILLTAHASLETAVEALREGAHDYLFKPCKTVELRESVRKGLLKRQQMLEQQQMLQRLEQHLTSELNSLRALLVDSPAASQAVPDLSNLLPPLPEKATDPGRFLCYGRLIVDLAQHVITLDGKLLELSPTEFNVMAFLVSEAPRVISPQELVREVQGYASETWEARDLARGYIFNIRQKVKEATGYADIIRNIRGVGYTING